MAVIPKADSIGLRSPTQTGAALKTPKLELHRGTAGAVAAANLRKQQQALDSEELSKAQVQYQLAQISEIEKFEEDDDIDTAHDKYGAAIDEQLAKAGQNITNTGVRELFMEKGSVVAAESKAKVNAKQFGKVKDRERGYAANYFSVIVDGAKNLEYGDPATAAVALRMSADSMVERNIMTRVEAEKALTTANDDIALGRLTSMPAHLQLEILNNMEGDNAWAKRVKPEVQKVLKAKAEIELADTMAMDFAFELVNQEHPPDRYQASLQIYAAFKDAPDYLRDNLVKNAQIEYGNLMTNRKMASTQKKLDTYDNIDLKARDPQSGLTLAQLNNKEGPYWEQWNDMDPSQRNNIETYLHAKATGKPIVTDRVTYLTLRQKFGAGPDARGDAIDYFLANHGKLSDTDFKFWDKELIRGEPTGMFDAQTRILKETEKWNWKDRSDILTGLERWYTGFQQTHDGAHPTDQQVTEQIKVSIDKKASGISTLTIPFTDYTFEWESDEEYPYSKDADQLIDTFEMHLADTDNPTAVKEFLDGRDPKQQSEIRYGYMKRRDTELVNDIIGGLNAKGVPWSMDQVQEAFANLYGTPERIEKRRKAAE